MATRDQVDMMVGRQLRCAEEGAHNPRTDAPAARLGNVVHHRFRLRRHLAVRLKACDLASIQPTSEQAKHETARTPKLYHVQRFTLVEQNGSVRRYQLGLSYRPRMLERKCTLSRVDAVQNGQLGAVERGQIYEHRGGGALVESAAAENARDSLRSREACALEVTLDKDPVSRSRVCSIA